VCSVVLSSVQFNSQCLIQWHIIENIRFSGCERRKEERERGRGRREREGGRGEGWIVAAMFN
jgi:hypothetical protein